MSLIAPIGWFHVCAASNARAACATQCGKADHDQKAKKKFKNKML
jgi:hypothetical protein